MWSTLLTKSIPSLLKSKAFWLILLFILIVVTSGAAFYYKSEYEITKTKLDQTSDTLASLTKIHEDEQLICEGVISETGTVKTVYNFAREQLAIAKALRTQCPSVKLAVTTTVTEKLVDGEKHVETSKTVVNDEYDNDVELITDIMCDLGLAAPNLCSESDLHDTRVPVTDN